MTTTVRKIPHQYINQIDTLKAEKYTEDMYFNPVEDADGNWFISEEEYIQMTEEIKNKYGFLITLEQIPYNPVTPIDPNGIPIGS